MSRLIGAIAGALALLGGQALLVSPASAELKLSISGSVRFNAIYADRGFGNLQKVEPARIPFDRGPAKDNTNDDSQVVLDARRTRLQLDISDAVADVKLAGRLQGDFDTTEGNARVSNSRGFRLRLAYGEASTAGFTLRAGQARTLLSEHADNLIGGVAVVEIVNENDHFDQLQARQAGLQAAWMAKIGGGDLTVGVGVEKQALTNLGSAAVGEDQGEGQDIPLFVAGVRYRSPLFAVFARFGGANARVTDVNGGDRNKSAWLGALGVDLKPAPVATIYAQYWVSEGLTRINDTALRDFVLVAGSLWRVKTEGGHGGVQLRPAKTFRINVGYQFIDADEPRQFLGTRAAKQRTTDRERIQTAFVNLIHRFWTRWETGLEYQFGRMDSFGPSAGEINIVNYRLRFYF